MKTIFKQVASACAVLFFAAGAAFLNAEPTGSFRLDYWTFGVDGNAHVEGSNTDVNNTSKMLKGQNWGIDMSGDIDLEGWGVNLDLFIGRQFNSQQLSSSESVDWDAQFTILTAGAFLSMVDHEFENSDRRVRFDGIAGLRSFSNSYKLQFNPYDPVNSKDRSDYVSWVDPYVGLRLKGQLNSALALGLYGDVGGFGIGNASELSMLTRADLIWTVMEGLNLIGGYRMFDLNTANESSSRDTQLDMRMGGPTLGFEILFQ